MNHCRNIDCPKWLYCTESCTKSSYNDKTSGVGSYYNSTEKTLVCTWKHKIKP